MPSSAKTRMKKMFGGRRRRSSLKSTTRFRRRKKQRKTNIDSLPDQLLIDILVSFPADFLLDRARLVCRRWCRIIRSHAFTTAHIQQHSTYGLLLSLSWRPHSIYVTATQGRVETPELSYIHRVRIMATCNGLALEVPYTNGNKSSLSLRLINPITKQSFRLPSVSTHNRHVFHDRCGLAYSTASMEYKITLPYSVDHVHCLDILTIGVDKSWRRVEISSLAEHVRSLVCLSPLTTEGFLHWGKERCCLTMNVETEMFSISEAPIPISRDQRYPYSCYYLSTGRHLSLLAGRRGTFLWEVWEMRPAESGDHWRKVLPNIDLEADKYNLSEQRLIYGADKCLLPFGWVKYPEVLAFCFSGLERTGIFYDRETDEINTIDLPHLPCSEYRGFVHRNSLVCFIQD